jgi:hypothetical protein
MSHERKLLICVQPSLSDLLVLALFDSVSFVIVVLCCAHSSNYAFDFLRSMCAELESFIDSRGPVIVGALDFAARGEIADEEVHSAEDAMYAEPAIQKIAPRPVRSLELALPDDNKEQSPASAAGSAAGAALRAASVAASVATAAPAPIAAAAPASLPASASSAPGATAPSPPAVLPTTPSSASTSATAAATTTATPSTVSTTSDPQLAPSSSSSALPTLAPPPLAMLASARSLSLLPPPPPSLLTSPSLTNLNAASASPSPAASGSGASLPPPIPSPSSSPPPALEPALPTTSGALFQSVIGANSLVDVYLLGLMAHTVVLSACDLLQV